MTRLLKRFLNAGLVVLLSATLASAQQTTTITSIEDAMLYNNTRPGYESTRTANYATHIRISALAWTNGGSPSYYRNMIRFNLSTIPTGAIIQSATFYVYSDPTQTSGANSNTGSNAFYLEKVTQSWGETTVNWNNQPPTTTADRVWVGPSTSTTENRQIDLTTLVQQWVNTPSSNFGVKMILENEVYYRSRHYASSNHSNTAIRPKLVVTYQPPLPPLAAPTGLSAAASSTTSVSLNWTDNADNEEGYEIWRSTSEGSGYVVIYDAPPNSTSYVDNGLASGTFYYYRVRAVNTAGSSSYSNTAGARTFYVPATPSEFTAQVTSSTTIALSWADNADNESGYQIERSVSSSGGYTVIATTDPNETSFNDNEGEYGVTYYYRLRAFNDIGSSQFVEASATIWRLGAGSFVDLYGFHYRYDARNRLIKKKVPGADWVYMVYDDRDRLVFTQDGNQRAENKWTFIKYDIWNRPIITGIYTHSGPATVDDLSGLLSTTIFFETRDNGVSHGYTNTVFPPSNFVAQNFEILTVTYYDDYSVSQLIGDPAFNYVPDDYIEQYKDANGKSFESVKDLVTATKTKVLQEDSFLWSVNYYDDRYRPVQNIVTNAKLNVDRKTNIYDFAGRVVKSKTVHNVDQSGEMTVARSFDYDHAGRLKRTWYSLNDQTPVLLSMYIYNELGQLITKRLHNEDPESTPDAQRAFKQDIDYRYNIRGWLTKINDVNSTGRDDLLKMSLYYDDPDLAGSSAQFNGNISQIEWEGPDAESKAYGFYYDRMNRLTKADFFNLSLPAQNGRFNEVIEGPGGSSGYDLNGNIQHLRRTGRTGEDGMGFSTYGEIDNLAYSYLGNKLLGVSDASGNNHGFLDASNTDDDYLYDYNGNMILDKNKDITGITTTTGASEISYNYLNLPEKVVKASSDYIKYTYDALGQKLRQQVFDASGAPVKTTDYVGEFIYENEELKFITHREGRVIVEDEIPEFQYFLKDHLGNVRLTFTATPDADSDKATFEQDNVDDEFSKFVRYEHARRVQSYFFDKTNGSAPSTVEGYAQRLNGGFNEKFGLARSLSVMPGDKVSAEVYAKYVDPASGNRTAALNILLGQIAQQISLGATTNGVVIDGQTFSASTAAFQFLDEAQQNTAGSTGAGPKAYLNWLVFDQDFKPILVKCGYMRLSDAPKETGQDVEHERLFSPEIMIDVPGYVYIYLSNENETPIDVYFDEFHVEHVKSSVVQMSDYYPFGLTFNSYQRGATQNQQYLYNGKELQSELDIGWIDYGARMYDQGVARWMVQDPHAFNYYNFSPYSHSLNSPTNFVDPDGKDVIFTIVRNENGEITGVKVSSTIHITGVGASEERAGQLNKGASTMFKSRTLDNGVTVSFDIKYKYSKTIESSDLKRGENVLNFVDKESTQEDRSHVNSFVLEPGNPATKRTGRFGEIYKRDWNDNKVVFHESLHFTGLSDRYYEHGAPVGSSNPMEGFENDIMGNYTDRLGYDHYQHYYNRATNPEMLKKFPDGSFLNRGFVDLDSRGYLIAPSKRQIDEQRQK